jgi:hypothetical protein
MWELAANYTGCMIGYHAVPVIVDAYVKGLRDYDLNKAMEAVVFSSVYDDQKPIPYNSDKVRADLMPKAKLYNATKGFHSRRSRSQIRLQGAGVCLQRLDHCDPGQKSGPRG